MPHINYLPDGVAVEIDPAANESILRVSIRAGVPHTHVCGGQARCSTCRVLVVDGLDALPPRNEREQLMADRLHFSPNIRLACQTVVHSDVTVRRLVLDKQDIELTSQLRQHAVPTRIGEEKRIAILFTDIRGFTSFSESLLPYDVIHVLNRYFNLMGHVINRNGGFINNYMGDGLMALFGDEQSDSKPALHAIRAGLEMLAALEEFKPYLHSVHGRTFDMGVGIHYGEAVVGALGAADSQRVTAIGDAVNFASRIESANKEAHTRLLISDDTYEQVKGQVVTGRTIRIAVKGKTGEHLLYEVTGLVPDPNAVASAGTEGAA